jgi:hypothetical protein
MNNKQDIIGVKFNHLTAIKHIRELIEYTYNGQTKRVAEWAKIYKVSAPTLKYRIVQNFPQDKIFNKTNIND